MYVRSHLDYVSGDRKYIYLDENKKKYIKDKHKYYPIKKYKGVYSLQKKRGGAPNDKEEGFIDVVLHVYDSIEEPTEFKAKIDMNDIILDYEDKTYKDIVKDNIISIFNKNYEKIIDIFTDKNINHFIIKKNSQNVFEVYFKKYSDPDNFQIDSYKNFYNIIYKRDNKISKYHNHYIDNYNIIFSINDSEIDVDNYIKIDEIYYDPPLYKSLIDLFTALFLKK
jgi:hypothetical protein